MPYEYTQKLTKGKRQILLFLSFGALLQAKPNHPLVKVIKYIPNITLELRYATNNNFLNGYIYTKADAFLVKEAALALANVQKELNKKDLGLKIWDAYRPLCAQWRMWEKMPDPRYVSDPRKGGRHTRGTTVDVTLIDLKTGKELPMGTDFDNFTPKAWPSYKDLPKEVLTNRKLLSSIMHKHGFTSIKTEWWHFDLHNWRDYPILDVDFEQLLTSYDQI